MSDKTAEPSAKGTQQATETTPVIADTDLVRLAATMKMLKELGIIANWDAVASAVADGFDEIGSKLEPLRQLTVNPNGDPLPRKTRGALKRLRAALQSPDLSKAQVLPVAAGPVTWIGEPLDADADDEAADQDGAPFRAGKDVGR
jgi:hypothetical protein